MPFSALAWLIALFDLVLFLVVALAGRRRSDCESGVRILGLRAWVQGFTVLGLSGAAKLLLIAVGRVHPFGLIRLLYLDSVVVLPIAAFVLLAVHRRTSRRITRPARIAAYLMLGGAPVGMYASFIEPYRTQLETPVFAVSTSRQGHEPVRLGILADIQTDEITAHEVDAIERLMSMQPDLVLMPGDLWQGTQADLKVHFSALKALLRRLDCPGGVYFTPGHCEMHRDVRPLLEGTPVRILGNEIIRLRVRDRQITLGGADVFYSPQAMAILRSLEQAPGDDDIRILVSHVPDYVLRMQPSSRIDLLVCGHTHGGQIVAPFFGPLAKSSRVPRAIAAGGLHELDGRHLYLSRGLGCERGPAPRIRFLCPPEVTLLTLR